jgi:hypothetical protein
MFKPSKQQIVDSCARVLGADYFLVHSVSLQATHLVVFASIKIAHLIWDVSSKELALGFKGTMGNKGAVSV